MKEKRNQKIKLKIKLNKYQIVWCLLSGITTGLVFSIPHINCLIWFTLIPFFYSLYSIQLNIRIAFKCSFLFSISFYIVSLHWFLRLHPLTWLGFSNLESILIVFGGLIFISLIVSLWIWIFGVLLALFKPEGWNRISYPFMLWIIIEWLQSLGKLSMPWSRLVLTQVNNLPILQISKWTGSIFISGLIILVNSSIACFIIEFLNKKYNNKILSIRQIYKLLSFKYLIIVILIWILIYGLGYYLLQSNKNLESKSINISLIQGNIKQDQKWEVGALYKILDTYISLSQEAISENKPQLVIWPESAIPVSLREFLTVDQQIPKFVYQNSIYLLTGIFDHPENNTNNYYNAAALFNPYGQIIGWYYKRHLVPFGEFIPFRDILSLVASNITNINALKHDIIPGKNSSIFNLPFAKIGTIICFESLYSELVRRSVIDGANLLVIITNDSWYKDSIAGFQHNSHAVLRAIENNRYILRSANTGISSIISPTGEVIQRTNLLEKTFINGKVKVITETTFFTKYGDWMIYLILIYLIVSFIVLKIKKLKRSYIFIANFLLNWC